MALTPSTMRDLGTVAPDFTLPTPDGKVVSRRDYVGKPLLIMFICNHCPYVKAIREELVKTCQELQRYGIGWVSLKTPDFSLPISTPSKIAPNVNLSTQSL